MAENPNGEQNMKGRETFSDISARAQLFSK
jgi:hypothetical protein